MPAPTTALEGHDNLFDPADVAALMFMLMLVALMLAFAAAHVSLVTITLLRAATVIAALTLLLYYRFQLTRACQVCAGLTITLSLALIALSTLPQLAGPLAISPLIPLGALMLAFIILPLAPFTYRARSTRPAWIKTRYLRPH